MGSLVAPLRCYVRHMVWQLGLWSDWVDRWPQVVLRNRFVSLGVFNRYLRPVATADNGTRWTPSYHVSDVLCWNLMLAFCWEECGRVPYPHILIVQDCNSFLEMPFLSIFLDCIHILINCWVPVLVGNLQFSNFTSTTYYLWIWNIRRRTMNWTSSGWR